MEGISEQAIAFDKALLSALSPICFVIGTFTMNTNLVIQLIVNLWSCFF